VATRDKRARATGRLGVKRGDRYALITEEVMTSKAYAALPDFAKGVLFAVACRYNGHNNGDLSLPYSEARKLGIAHQWKLYAGLQVLKITGLVLCTRQGKLEGGAKVCSLYALTWRGIDSPGEGVAYDAGVAVRPIAGNDWANWEKPVDWLKTTRAITAANHGRKANPVSTTVGKGHSTTMGAKDRNIDQPRWGKERAFVAPPLVDTSKTPPGPTHPILAKDECACPVANRNLRTPQRTPRKVSE
jgi:hypothetical protein